MFTYMSVYTPHAYMCLQRSEGKRAIESRVTDACEPPDVGAKNWTQVLQKTSICSGN